MVSNVKHMFLYFFYMQYASVSVIVNSFILNGKKKRKKSE